MKKSKIKQEIKEVIVREIKHIPKSLKDMAKQDNLVMSIIKTNEIRHIIAGSDKGDLALMLRKGDTHREYHFLLDAVPVSKEQNENLLKVFNGILFTI